MAVSMAVNLDNFVLFNSGSNSSKYMILYLSPLLLNHFKESAVNLSKTYSFLCELLFAMLERKAVGRRVQKQGRNIKMTYMLNPFHCLVFWL
jgi:hypothetical protein